MTNYWPNAARPFRSNPPEGTVGIALSIRDNLKFFKLAFHSLLDFTNYRFMLTIVDNMNSYTTRQYLESVRRNHNINVVQYQSQHAQGAEWNMGLRFMFSYSTVQYGVALTPDIVVEPNWLLRMVNLLNEKNDSIITCHSYESTHEAIIRPNEVGRLNPFCASFKRSSYERIGGFDELLHESGPVMQDFGDRALKAGLRLLCDHDVYMHHFTQTPYLIDPDHLAQDKERLKTKVTA